MSARDLAFVGLAAAAGAKVDVSEWPTVRVTMPAYCEHITINLGMHRHRYGAGGRCACGRHRPPARATGGTW